MDPVTLAAIIGGAAEFGGMLFSKHQADTAHQREVRDLAKAGINPLMTANTRGAPMPETPRVGDTISRAVGSGLQLKMANAQLELIQAQKLETLARARQATVGADAVQATTPFELALKQGDIRLRDAQSAVAEADARKLESLLPYAVEHMMAEIRSKSSSAQALDAERVLRELAQAGALNESNFQKRVGELGPWGRVVMDALKIAGAGAVGAAVLKKPAKGLTIINKVAK